MAGGSRIVISDQGITISTNGKIIYQAGQHIFEDGQKVVSSQVVLPSVMTQYSNKFDYVLPQRIEGNTCIENPVGCFVIEKSTGKLIASNSVVDEKNITSRRFYTEEKTEVIGIIGFSDTLFASQDNDLDTDCNDPLLDEALSKMLGED